MMEVDYEFCMDISIENGCRLGRRFSASGSSYWFMFFSICIAYGLEFLL
jgi:hypothetical protein